MKKIKKHKNNYYIKFLISAFTFCFLFIALPADASSLAQRLSGRILLQVEEKGEAYYINPADLKRYYLGRPHDAFEIMRSFGLGTSNSDIDNFIKNGARANLAGKILLKVQDKGQAYYVNPINLRLYYLGRPADAFSVMRQLGLGIKNSDLNQIILGNIGTNNASNNTYLKPGEKVVTFTWKYKNKQYSLNQIYSDDLYNQYKNSEKNFYYYSNNPPANMREEYYNIFLKQKTGDNSIVSLLTALGEIANKDGLSEDEFVEFVMAFVQYIPYNFSKSENDPQNFPYETLYTNTGVCSDFAFLAVLLLRGMGYGAAIFDYPDIKHSAAAVLCSSNSSYNSGYCFIETTNFFPIGVFPGGLSSGQAGASTTNWNNVFNDSSLGKVEILQKTTGKKYGGVEKTAETVDFIKKLESSLSVKSNELQTIQSQLNQLQLELSQISAQAESYKQAGDWDNYNKKVDEYNNKANYYNGVLENYRLKLEIYNLDIALFNKTIKDFYQN